MNRRQTLQKLAVNRNRLERFSVKDLTFSARWPGMKPLMIAMWIFWSNFIRMQKLDFSNLRGFKGF